jgi:uncharacterized protein YggU (UPF0235/DUF167 family)
VPPSCLLPVKVVPNAPRTAVAGWLGDALKVRVQAPPVAGRANAALCAGLAERLGLPGAAVSVARGTTASRKLVRIEGLDLAAVRQRLAPPENP